MTARALLLSSGGLDSTTIAYQLAREGIPFQPCFYDYGQHCAEKEWSTLKSVLPPIGGIAPIRIDLSAVFEGSASRMIKEPNLWKERVDDSDLYIPYRTLFFLSTAAAIAQTRGFMDVYSGFINSNHAKEIDCSDSFLNGMGELAEGIGTVRFLMPLRYWSKADVVAEAVRLGVPIGRTFSCQVLSDIPCGACPNCVERLNAIEVVRKSL